MSVWDDMAHDGGFRGDEARQVAMHLEQQEREHWERVEREHWEELERIERERESQG